MIQQENKAEYFIVAGGNVLYRCYKQEIAWYYKRKDKWIASMYNAKTIAEYEKVMSEVHGGYIIVAIVRFKLRRKRQFIHKSV